MENSSYKKHHVSAQLRTRHPPRAVQIPAGISAFGRDELNTRSRFPSAPHSIPDWCPPLSHYWPRFHLPPHLSSHHPPTTDQNRNPSTPRDAQSQQQPNDTRKCDCQTSDRALGSASSTTKRSRFSKHHSAFRREFGSRSELHASW